MNMNKIVLAVAIAATTSFANAAVELEIDVGTVIKEAAIAESSAVNLAVNNVSNIIGNVELTATDINNLDIETTAIGAVQSGFIAIENKLVQSIGSATGSLNETLDKAHNVEFSYIDNSVDNNIQDTIAQTTNTFAQDLSDTSEVTGITSGFHNIGHEISTTVTDSTSSFTAESINTDFSALNAAYNNAVIDASVKATGYDASHLGGKIHTTAIGAVQSGNIVVTVK